MDQFTAIQKIISDKLGISPESIRMESKAKDLSGWDSVNHIMIISEIEDTFDFKFRLEEIGEMDSVQKIVRAIQERGSR